MLRKEIGLFILILVTGAVTASINPQFISPVNLINLANQIGLFGLLAMGLGIVIVTGGIELSVGSMLALLGVIFLDLLVNYELPWPVVFVIVVLGGTALGAMHGLLISRLNLQPFVVTLCGLLIYRGIARYYTNDSTEGFGYAGGYGVLEWLTSGRTWNIPHTFIFFVLVALAMAVLLHKSVLGRYIFAIGKNEEAARFSGIPTSLVIVWTYAISGLLTGISTVFFVFYTQSVSPSAHGNFYELYAIAAAVLGGCSLRGGEGSILGIALGVVLLQVLQNLVNMLGIPSSLNFAVMGAVILIGVIVDGQLQQRSKTRQRAMSARSDGPREANAPSPSRA